MLAWHFVLAISHHHDCQTLVETFWIVFSHDSRLVERQIIVAVVISMTLRNRCTPWYLPKAICQRANYIHLSSSNVKPLLSHLQRNSNNPHIPCCKQSTYLVQREQNGGWALLTPSFILEPAKHPIFLLVKKKKTKFKSSNRMVVDSFTKPNQNPKKKKKIADSQDQSDRVL